ncbi:unnamed protein product, partial [Adineta steineri]
MESEASQNQESRTRAKQTKRGESL